MVAANLTYKGLMQKNCEQQKTEPREQVPAPETLQAVAARNITILEQSGTCHIKDEYKKSGWGTG